MIFITGGRYQGKLKCALNISEYDEDDVFDFARPNSEEYALSHKKFNDCSVWYNLEEYVRTLAGNDTDKEQIEKIIKSLVETNAPEIIIMSEVGAGVIPISKNDNVFREAAGRLSVYFAEKADEVYRVICGVKTQLK